MRERSLELEKVLAAPPTDATELRRRSLELEKVLAAPPTDATELRRRSLQGQLVNLSAQYLNAAFKLVNSASEVISANLTDLAGLSTQIRDSDRPSAGGRSLTRRIDENIAAGRAMRGALTELRTWAQTDASLAPRFESLRRITSALDRRISIDKARLAGSQRNRDGSVFDERLAAIDRTVDELGDMYAGLMAEKAALTDLRDEVSLAVQLGRLEMTREVAARAVPRFVASPRAQGGADALADIAGRIAAVNDSLITETSGIERRTIDEVDAVTPPPDLEIGGFANF